MPNYCWKKKSDGFKYVSDLQKCRGAYTAEFFSPGQMLLVQCGGYMEDDGERIEWLVGDRRRVTCYEA